MARPTAFKHQGLVCLNRADGSAIMLTTEEAAAIVALLSPASEAGAAAQRHLDAHGRLLGRSHGDEEYPAHPPRLPDRPGLSDVVGG